jgi:hypothetical protein
VSERPREEVMEEPGESERARVEMERW